MLLGGKHLYFHLEYDPEGILSTCMAIINTFAGLESARLITCMESVNLRIFWCFLIGSVFIAMEIFLVNRFPDIAPVSKPLWTCSFLFLTVGCSFWCLALCGLWAKVAPSTEITVVFLFTQRIDLCRNGTTLLVGWKK